MQVGLSRFKKCPHCGHKNEYHIGPFYVNFYGFTVWSDGHKFSEIPSLQKRRLQSCKNCSKFYWHTERWGGLDLEGYVNALDYYQRKYTTNPIKYCLYRNRLLYIRLNLWRSYNDFFRVYPHRGVEKKEIIIEEKFTKAYIENAKELIKHLGTRKNQNIFYVAELYRNIGDFDNAKATLNKLKAVEFELSKQLILNEVNKGNQRVIAKEGKKF